MAALDFSERASEMRVAVQNGKLAEKFRQMLDQHGTADIAFGSLTMLSFLISNSASIDDCRRAIENGASESVWKKHERIPEMHFAATNEDPAYIELLLDSGFSLESLDIDENTPLHSAIQDGTVDVANTLLRRGANPDMKNRRKESPRDLAAIYGVKGLCIQ